MTAYVLDSFAVLAHLTWEPGRGSVQALLTDAEQGRAELWLCLINLGEVLFIVERRDGLPAAQDTAAAVDQWPVEVAAPDRALTFAAAHIKTQHAISYADSFAVALAQQTGASVVTGDPEFRRVEGLIPVHWLAQQPPPAESV